MDKIPYKPEKPGAFSHAVSFFEPFHATGGVEKLLLTGEKGMAGRADLCVDFRLGRAALEGVAAQAFHRDVLVLGMNSFFHIFLLAVILTADLNVT